jgi:CxxC motif-containing protein
MRSLTCIVCPIGCLLEAEETASSPNETFDNLSVTGNRCPRGVTYAREEIRAPKRIVTATCKIEGEKGHSVKRVPVKTVFPCPREKIPALLDDIYKLRIILPVKTGDILIADWRGEGIAVAVTRTIT